MPSSAAEKFGTLTSEVEDLIDLNWSFGLPLTARRSIYRAGVVILCAAWEAYIEDLVLCYYDETSPFKLGYANPHHGISKTLASTFVHRFHTPNSVNVRALLLQYTGCDPWPAWTWPHAGLNSMQNRERLDEILRVRHSVAHGAPLPATSWTISGTGRVGLTALSMRMCQNFFRNLVAKTDNGMKDHINANFSDFGISVTW